MKEHSLQVDENGQVTLPTEILEKLGLQPGETLQLKETGSDLTLLSPTDKLEMVYVELTNKCNLHCRTCMRNDWSEDEDFMPEAVIDRILEDLSSRSPIPRVFLGGFGEPLFHPHVIETVQRFKALGTQVDLITNGILLSEQTSRELIDAGLDTLWVSLDGATPENYADVRLGDHLPQIIENLEHLQKLRAQRFGDSPWQGSPKLGIAFVAMKRNIHELPEVLRLGSQLGARQFMISNVLAYTEELAAESLYARTMDSSGHTLESSALPRVFFPRMDTDESTEQTLLEVLKGDYLINLSERWLGQNTHTCPFLERRSVSIRWDGEVSPCLPLLHNHTSYLDGRRHTSYEYSLGNILETDLEQIIHAPEYAALRQRLDSFHFSPCTYCNSCEMADDNLTDCFGSPHPACGTCLWAQGLIRCP
jgi:AbrB family looped-hinge helix DNA binding protein